MRKLTDPELDEISEMAVKAAENFIFSQVSKKEILNLDISVELSYEEGLDVDVLVDLDLDELSSADLGLADEAVDHALEKVDKFLANLPADEED